MNESIVPQPADVIFTEGNRLIEMFQKHKGFENSEKTHVAIMCDQGHVIEAMIGHGVRLMEFEVWKETRTQDTRKVVLRSPKFRLDNHLRQFFISSSYYMEENYSYKSILQNKKPEEGEAICSSLIASLLIDSNIIEQDIFSNGRNIYPAELYNHLLEFGCEQIDFNMYKNQNIHPYFENRFLADFTIRQIREKIELDMSWIIKDLHKTYSDLKISSDKNIIDNFIGKFDKTRGNIFLTLDESFSYLLSYMRLMCISKIYGISNWKIKNEIITKRNAIYKDVKELIYWHYKFLDRLNCFAASILSDSNRNYLNNFDENQINRIKNDDIKIEKRNILSSVFGLPETEISEEHLMPCVNPEIDMGTHEIFEQYKNNEEFGKCVQETRVDNHKKMEIWLHKRLQLFEVCLEIYQQDFN